MSVAKTGPQRDRLTKEYATDEIVVEWEPRLCYHSQNCVRSLPQVFDDSRRPWVKVEAATADEVEAAVARCPSGALRTRRVGAQAALRPEPLELRASANGPLLVSGGVRILDALGAVLYQAEWCPFSSAVREVLTELGVDFVARQVEPWPNERSGLGAVAGTGQIPVLQTEDGRLYRGTREIFAHLHRRDPWRFAAAHRRRFADHRDARESDAPGQLIEYFRGTDELEAGAGSVADAEVVDVPEASRFELRLGGHLIGLAAYRRRNGRIAFTHTEVEESHEGHGFGSRLAAGALEAARREGVEVVPLCPFIARYIDRHPEYEELVASGYRNR